MSARRARLRAALAAAAGVLLGYQAPLDQPLRAESPLLATSLASGFYPGDEGYRWTAGEARLRLPDVGPGRHVRVELDVDGWRPPGERAPVFQLASQDARTSLRLEQPGTVTLLTRARGLWRADVELVLRAETFQPRNDPRSLGVRFHRLRVSDEGPWRPHWPPLRPVALAALAAALLLALIERLELRRALPVALVAAGLVPLAAFASERLWADALLTPAVLALGLAWAWAARFPGGPRRLLRSFESSSRALGVALSRLARPELLASALAGLLLLIAAERGSDPLELDLGSGQEEALATGLGPYDSQAGRAFRSLRRGATLDLSSLGRGPFRLTLLVSAPGARPALRVANAGDVAIDAPSGVSEAWQPLSVEVPAPDGALRLEFTAQAEAAGVRAAHLSIERSAGWPSWKPVLWAFASGLACLLLLATAVASARVLAVLGLLVWSGLALCFLAAPLVVWPHSPSLAAVAWLAVPLWFAAYSLTVARADAQVPAAPGILAAASLGFVGWFGALTWPLYRGGHFGFHSQIAEEIWRGAFWRYYLPYPGSMLSRQAQWGDVIVPHPCLYQVLIAPLASLPHEWFHWAEKLVLALLLAAVAVTTGRLAERAGGPRLGTCAAALFCALVPTYQLLGLGHLMTLLGVWASALALSFVARNAPLLLERRVFLVAVGLLTVAFLSYTAALLFTGLVLFALALLSWPRERRLALQVLMVLAGAGLLAFALYYVHWTWPFLSQSIPRWLSRAGTVAAGTPTPAGDQADRWARLLAQPGKLSYSYGHWLLPVLASASLWIRPVTLEWRVLRLWMGVLWLFSLAVDPFFNLLLKHHYFVAVPVAVGLGASLALDSPSRVRRWSSWALVLLVGLLGLQKLVVVATGGAP